MPEALIRVVFDTNIFLSYFLMRHGTIGRAVEFVLDNGILLASSDTLAELTEKMTNSGFAKRYGTEMERMQFVERLRQVVTLVSVVSVVQASRDPDDDKFLALARDGRADCIVTGDKRDLLPLHPFQGIPILSAADFVAQFVVR